MPSISLGRFHFWMGMVALVARWFSLLDVAKTAFLAPFLLDSLITSFCHCANTLTYWRSGKLRVKTSLAITVILGSGKGLRTSLLFTSLKSLTVCTVLFCFGTMKEGDTHSESSCFLSTCILQSRSTSLLRSPNGLLVLGRLALRGMA